MNVMDGRKVYQNIYDNIQTVIKGQSAAIRKLLAAFVGYIQPEEEVELLSAQIQQHPIDRISPCVDLEAIAALMNQVKQVRVSPRATAHVHE